MPHKRAKRAIRERTKHEKGHNLAPTRITGLERNSNVEEIEPIPKSAIRVLNALRIREGWRSKKRKRGKDSDGLDEEEECVADKKRREMGTDQQRRRKVKEEQIKAKLRIKPGESMQHFNRRVEDDMRPLIIDAIQTSKTVLRQSRKAAAVGSKGKKLNSKRSSEKKGTELSPSPVGAIRQSSDDILQEFQKYSSSVPRRLNDVVCEPPDMKRLPRGSAGRASSVQTVAREGILSFAQKEMMEKERERFIIRYRELKSSKHSAELD